MLRFILFHFFLCIIGVNYILAETLVVDFADYDGEMSSPVVLVGQHGWRTVNNYPSPTVAQIEQDSKKTKVVRTVAQPTVTEQGKPCIAALPVDFQLSEQHRVIVIETDIMVEGLTPDQIAMVGFGKNTPVQFGIHPGGMIAVRDDQWGKTITAIDNEGRHFVPEHGVWYRFRMEINPVSENQNNTQAVGRLFLKNISGNNVRIPKNQFIPIVFDYSGKRTFTIPLDLKFPVSQWDTVWLRISNSDQRGCSYISRIIVSTVEHLTPVPKNTFLSETFPEPIRSAEETERILRLSKSDVLLSSRWKHPTNASDPYDTIKAITDYHATRNEWSYCDDADFIKLVKSKVKTYAGTVNTLYRIGKKNEEKAYPGQITSRDGKSVTAPWMMSFHGWWGCVNSKEYRNDYIKRIERLINGGIDSIHMDDPGSNVATITWGGCFCPYCIDGFRNYLKKYLPETSKNTLGNLDEFDVRTISSETPLYWKLFHEFQCESVQKFYEDIKSIIDKRVERKILFSMNNYGGSWRFPSDIADFGVAEINEKSVNPLNLFYRIERARRQGKIQIFTMAFRDIHKNRFTYSMLYACGSHAIIPWDVYITSNSSRLFIPPEEFADLSGFVRAMAPFLNDYSTDSVAGTAFDEFSENSLSVSGSETLCALARRPKNGNCVIHLVEWSNETSKTQLKLNPQKYWNGNRPTEVILWTPLPYEPSIHKKAEQSGDYSRLAQSEIISVRYNSDDMAIIDLPHINCWGIITVP
jgi:hypothetical protein